MKNHRFFKGAFCRIVAFLLMLVLGVSFFATTVAAQPIQTNPYDTYTYWTAPGTKWAVSSAPMYEYKTTIDAGRLGISGLKNPSDVFTDHKGLIYIMDTGNGRVVVLNADYTLRTVIQNLTFKGKKLNFTGATGLFVTEKQEIYIADTENARVIVTTLKGKVLDVLTLPKAEIIPGDFIYRPAKIAVDSNGFTYILSDGSYYGALLYKPDGSFSGFYGSNSVEGSILGAFEKIYDMLFVSETQKLGAEKSLPYSFTDIAIQDDFVFTATGAVSANSSNAGQLKKLSPSGINVLNNKTKSSVTSAETTNFSDSDVGVGVPTVDGYYRWRVSNIGSMDVDKNGFMYGFCKNYGRVFVFDQECNQLGVFGGGAGSGNQNGTFASGTSVHVNDLNEEVLVVDSLSGSLTVFKQTPYGALLKKAQTMINDGDYVEAKPYWEQVLSTDRNQQLAYRGLARAALLEEDYTAALEYAKLGYDQDTYATAFVFVRNDYLSRNFVWIFGLALLLVGGIIAFLVYSNKREVKLIKNPKLRTMFSCVFHPFEGAKEVRYYDRGSSRLATFLLVLFFLSTVIQEMYTGFMYNAFDKSTYSAVFSLLRTVGLVVLWSVANWAMTTLFQGKGTMKQVYIVTCYALLPQIASNVLCTLLSNMLSPEEQLVITAISTVCLALTAIMLCVGVMTVHEYGFFKFIVMTIVVVLAMLVAVFVLLMMFVLIQQLFNFIGMVYKEVNYR